MHLARQVLEEPVELVEVPVGGRQEPRRIRRRARTDPHPTIGISPDSRDVDHLEHRLVAEPLDPPRHAHQLAPLEPAGERIRVLERTGLDRPAAIAQLEREVRRPRCA